MARANKRRADALRTIEIQRGYTRNAAGSVLVKTGETVVLCTACFEASVPRWREGSGSGWVTAEYDMLPGSTSSRKQRNRGKIDGRTQEIQRLIGRSLRAVVDLSMLGENSILIDCDVLQADGGTRTASISGAYVALADAIRFAMREKIVKENPITDSVAAVSVGIVNGKVLLDLDYSEDSSADVDMNLVMTGSGGFIEVQGTGEQRSYTRKELDRMVALGDRGIRQIMELQQKALRKRLKAGG
ncbi:MAG: ribonuclease PH [Phycisphaerae bacterium]